MREQDIVCVLLAPHDLSIADLPSCAVAAVSETPWPDAAEPHRRALFPCVEGLGPRARSIREGDLVLVDGDRGAVLANPTDRNLAAFQAHTIGIAPVRRLYLDFTHQPVRLPNGREVHVSASVTSTPHIGDAVESGPDALFVSEECGPALIPAVVRAAHGKPISFSVDPGQECERALLTAATIGEVTAFLPLGDTSAPFDAFREALQEAAEELLVCGQETGRVRSGICLTEGVSPPELALAPGVERVVVRTRGRSLDGAWLQDLLEAARSVVVPVEVAVERMAASNAERVLDLGINGVIVPPPDVQRWKEALRKAVAPV